MGFAHSDVGRVRTVNQDAALVSERLGLFAVADGMGGHRGGEVASELALDALARTVEGGPIASSGSLIDAVLDANEAVFDQANGDPDLRGMGTTLCALALVEDADGERLVIANVGDSRAYVLQDGELVQVTEDHSLVAEMVRGGHLTPDEAAVHPKRNIVTRALGIEADVAVDYWERDAVMGERYLLCSDGLFNEVAEPRIAATLRQVADAARAAKELVELANAAGGRDNVTCLVVDVTGSSSPGEEPVGPRRRRAEEAPDVDPGPTAARSLAAELAGPPPPQAPRPRRFTLRVGLFALALALVAGAAYVAVRTFARNNYFVAAGGDEVVIYRGRPGGVLWFDPVVAQQTGVPLAALTQSQRAKVDEQFQTSSLQEARRWVEQQLVPVATAPATTTTAGPTTTASAPNPTVPSTVPVGPVPAPGATTSLATATGGAPAAVTAASGPPPPSTAPAGTG